MVHLFAHAAICATVRPLPGRRFWSRRLGSLDNFHGRIAPTPIGSGVTAGESGCCRSCHTRRRRRGGARSVPHLVSISANDGSYPLRDVLLIVFLLAAADASSRTYHPRATPSTNNSAATSSIPHPIRQRQVGDPQRSRTPARPLVRRPLLPRPESQNLAHRAVVPLRLAAGAFVRRGVARRPEEELALSTLEEGLVDDAIGRRVGVVTVADGGGGGRGRRRRGSAGDFAR
mmetsp:Transcript_34825/g.74189  ORF Transcript_34825/g.74189 Transcript_34825/m.74189 type:complete len:231 (+) Transcript_34825:2176-2868(+)